MNCKELATAEVCFDNGAGVLQSLVAHYEYGLNAAGNTILVSTIFADAAGVPVDTSAGTVTVGACATASPSIDWEQLCDVQADGSVVEFMCQVVTSFDANGAVIVPSVATNYELDKVTPYTPTGTIGACGQDCDAAIAQGVLTTWG